MSVKSRCLHYDYRTVEMIYVKIRKIITENFMRKKRQRENLYCSLWSIILVCRSQSHFNLFSKSNYIHHENDSFSLTESD